MYVLFDMSYVFTCRAQWPLGSNRSSFLGCCMVRNRRLMWSRRLTRRWRLTWSRRLPRRRMVGRMMVGRRRVQDKGRPAAGQLQVS
jgi:hypothetical protein